MSGAGKNFIGYATGMKRSGKSHLLALLSAKFDRRLIFDFIGEFIGKVDGARYAYTLNEAIAILKDVRKNGRKWTVVCVMPPADAIALCKILAPVGKRPEQSFSYAVGGIVIECGEIDLIAPNNASIDESVSMLFARGRHYSISVLGGSRRPREVHRIVTSQADAIFMFRQHELRDIDYLANLTRSDATALIRTLRPHEYVSYKVNYNELAVVDANGNARVVPAPG